MVAVYLMSLEKQIGKRNSTRETLLPKAFTDRTSKYRGGDGTVKGGLTLVPTTFDTPPNEVLITGERST